MEKAGYPARIPMHTLLNLTLGTATSLLTGLPDTLVTIVPKTLFLSSVADTYSQSSLGSYRFGFKNKNRIFNVA